MFENKTEAEAREEILGMVEAYYGKYHRPEVSQNSRALSTRFFISCWS